MLLLRAEGGFVEVGRRRRPHATWLTGIAFCVMAALPLLGAGPMTAQRWLATVALTSVAAALFWFARGGRQAMALLLEQGVLRVDGQQVAVKDASFVLAAGRLGDEAARSRYRVCLRLEGRPDRVLLEGRSPDRVLTDLRAILAQIDLPVHTGWGLPEHAQPWRRCRETHPLPVRDLSLAPFQRQGQLALTITVCTIGMFVAISLMVSARLDRGTVISWYSYVLSYGTAILAGLVAGVVWTDRRVARLAPDGVEFRRRVLGLVMATRRVSAEGWIGAYRVHTDDDDLAHVLIDLGDRLAALPCAGEPAEPLERAIASW